MSRDPYHDFAADLRNSLGSARSLADAYRQLSSNAASASGGFSSLRWTGELQSAHDKLADALEGLRQDVEDVKQSVQVVERSGPERFGVSPEELDSRKRFVKECEDEIQQLSQIATSRPGSSSGSGKGKGREGFQAIEFGQEEDENVHVAFEREQQQILMERQDTTLDKIGSTLVNLQNQAGMMGQEIGEQIELIGALDNEVDRSQGRLSRAMRQMDEVVRISDERLGGWCVWILIVVLFFLLLIVFLI